MQFLMFTYIFFDKKYAIGFLPWVYASYVAGGFNTHKKKDKNDLQARKSKIPYFLCLCFTFVDSSSASSLR